MNRHTVVKTALAAGVLALMAGCGAMHAANNVEVFEATLSGSQEVPPTGSPGTGEAEVRLDKATNMLSWKVSYSGLTGPAVAGHIHGPGGPGANANVSVPFSNAGTSPIIGQATVNAAQIAQLEAGQMYVNVHTPAHKGGEIRGQLHRRQ